MKLSDYALAALDGTGNVLDLTRGKVTLVVNVASKCGFTPQYEGLERLWNTYREDGLLVLGCPCNQFGGQEPGSPEEIRSFCTATYGVSFPLSEKLEVNGGSRHPLYAALTEVSDESGYEGDIRWNFEKFLVSSDGSRVSRFPSSVSPDAPALLDAVQAELEKAATPQS